MTEFTLKQKGKKFEITCNNHAVSDVCRGVSALIYALVNKLRFDDEKGKIRNVNIKLDDGFAEFSFEYKYPFLFESMAVVETIVLGIKGIAERYPEELKVTLE